MLSCRSPSGKALHVVFEVLRSIALFSKGLKKRPLVLNHQVTLMDLIPGQRSSLLA